MRRTDPWRIGPRQWEILLLAIRSPGHVKSWYGNRVGPSRQYGNDALNRAEAAGLVIFRDHPERRGSYLVYPTEDGEGLRGRWYYGRD